MNTHEAAQALGITVSCVRNQCEKGVFSATKIGRAWNIGEAEVERYRRERLGRRDSWTGRRNTNPARLAALRSSETKAKMRAAKLGRRHTPEHIAKVAAAHRGKPLTAEHREAIRSTQRGKTLDPSHLEHLRAYHVTRRGRPLPMATKRKIAESLERAYREGRRSYSTLEDRAATLLIPLGFERSVRLDHHVFDFGAPDGPFLIEVNGCAWHNHRHVNPACPVRTRRDSNAKDEERRAIARLHDRILIELWGCEEARWSDAIALIA